MNGLSATEAPQDQQGVRTAWLAAKLTTAKEVDFPQYQARFFRTLRSYYRDLSLVARAGVKYKSERPDHGHVVLVGVDL